jgi:hypothetical protein
MLSELISQRRGEVSATWRGLILASYPAETARVLSADQDRFANPVGHLLAAVTDAVVAGLVEGRSPEELAGAIDGFIRVRAVQDLTPAQAVGFVLELKAVFREQLAGTPWAPDAASELRALEDWVDRLLLVAFDVFARCREQVYAIRVNEIRNRSLKVMERLNEWRAGRDGAGADPGRGRVVRPG